MQILNKQNEKLSCEVRGEIKDTLAIVCHGLADTKNNPFLAALCCALEEEGISSLRFDFSGNGKSEGEFTAATYHKEQEDLQSVVDHFKNEGVSSFVLVGHSMGGGIIKLVAADEQNKDCIKGIVPIAGVSNPALFASKFPDLAKKIRDEGRAFLWEEKFGKRFPLTMEYLESVWNIPLPQTAMSVHCPVLCVQGDKDTPERAGETREWLSRLPQDTSSTFVILKDVDHFFNRFQGRPEQERAQKELCAVVLPWICQLIAE